MTWRGETLEAYQIAGKDATVVDECLIMIRYQKISSPIRIYLVFCGKERRDK